MSTNTMTPQERFWAAVNLQECDRVPVGMPLSWFTARHAGITMAEFAINCKANAAASFKAYQDLGEFEVVPFLNFSPVAMGTAMPIKQKFPGRELPPDSIIQYHEQEIMQAEEYDIVINKGWNYYNKEYVLPRTHPEFTGPGGEKYLRDKQQEVNRTSEKMLPLYEKKSILFTSAVMAMPPFEMLSMARSFSAFLLDLYRRPNKVTAAMEVMMAESIETITSQLKASRKIFGSTAISRSASTFISPKHFEKFVFPYIKEIADIYMANDLTMVFHLDQDWLKFLPYFKELPEGRYIIELDGLTDIFEAKKIIGDRMCLMGDVPARMFKLGTRRDVEQYCRKLIDVVGKGSGFILSCG
jgi:uroporphyrinogen-III decarboxylase